MVFRGSLLYILAVVIFMLSLSANIILAKINEEIDYKLGDVYRKQQTLHSIERVLEQDILNEPVVLSAEQTKFHMLNTIDSLSRMNINNSITVLNSFFQPENRIMSIKLNISNKDVSEKDLKDLFNMLLSNPNYDYFILNSLKIEKYINSGAIFDAEVEYRKIYR